MEVNFFYAELRNFRREWKFTQADLAKFLDVSPRAIWQWEQGKLPHVLTQEAVLARLKQTK